MKYKHLPKKQGLYDPRFEKDSCGVGFVCNIDGWRSHEIIKQGIGVLKRLAHRGAVGADPETGDGAGMSVQLPHEFFKNICDFSLPEPKSYGVGMVFLPQNRKERNICENIFLQIIKSEKQKFLGWRKVPVKNNTIGKGARQSEPSIKQIFIERGAVEKDELSFERKLYIIRKRVENAIRQAKLKEKTSFHVTSLSCRMLVYKGLLMPHQLERFYPDLIDKSFKSAICLVHSRYSTNTFPTWDLAQPFRYLAHNGEINTLRGNINWMRAREGLLESKLFGKSIKHVKPVIVPGGSDSAGIDNMFELLYLSGRSMEQAITMLIPAAWGKYTMLSDELKEFYKYHACIMEPWDGPAAIAFTDGVSIGAVLDRNGLRPARYIITKKGFVVMASEVGVLDIPPEEIEVSARLEPGKMFFIDTEKKKIIDDAQIKKTMGSAKPYTEWNKRNLITLESLPNSKDAKNTQNTSTLLKAFGYTREDLKFIISPMASEGMEPIGSMGNDTPHAALSKKPSVIYNYFKQLFAQVTNPAIDSIRENFVMSLRSFVGPQRNILDEVQGHSRKLDIAEPILSSADILKIKNIHSRGFRSKTISLLFKRETKNAFRDRLNSICLEAEKAIKNGFSFVILSDKGVNRSFAAIPALVAVGGVHQYLLKKSMRSQIGIIVESAEPREVHHFALLFGYGADCINPYLVFDAIKFLANQKEIEVSEHEGIKNYIIALKKGILKILSKMGISTLRSYRGAQIFEAVGLGEDVIKLCFTGTPSRIGGADLNIIAAETISRHDFAFKESLENGLLDPGGIYQWRKNGEFHLWNPESIAALQDAAKKGDYEKYKLFAKLINDQSKNPCTLRGLFKFKKRKPIPINQVEPVEKIITRFATGAMSFGSISRAAHETLALAMNRLGAKSNTGEGGEDPARFEPLANGDSKRSSIKQVASGRFGVATNYLINADELQIKIAQGAKPGEGGQLPGHKVSETIARIRYTTPGVTLISPPPHHDIYSIEDLAELIYDLKNVNPKARISVKLVSEIGVGTVAAGVAKGHADMILISGGDGGTGASPLSSIKHAGLPWELGLSEAHQTLVLNDLRSRVRLQTDGQMRTGRDVAIAAMLGAEEYGFCTAALIVMGCVMLRHCHLNNCSVGIATQDEILQKRFRGSVEHVVNYFRFVTQELREIMAELGVQKVDDLIGRTDFLAIDKENLTWKAKNIDFSKILYKPKVPKNIGHFCQKKQDHAIEKVLDRTLIKEASPALENKGAVKKNFLINNTMRVTGAMLSGKVCEAYGENGLPDNTIHYKFEGTAGQSFGAFLAKGITFELSGMANDYVGKGISGGKIIVYPSKKARYRAEDNIIIGNTTFYGAISGEAYIRGIAGERFCIRNSGINAVVEGVGDHGCEYMTGGKVIIIGRIGRNFAAGMSGGIAYVYNREKDIKDKCNIDMVHIEHVANEDTAHIMKLLRNHLTLTGSAVAAGILDNFNSEIKNFVKIIPIEYKRIIENKETKKELDIGEVSDG